MRLFDFIFRDYWRVVLEMIRFSGDIQVLLFCLLRSDRSGVAGQTGAMRAVRPADSVAVLFSGCFIGYP